MKKILILIAVLLLLTVWVSAQKSAPIQVYNAGELVFSMSEDTVHIGGVFPITMNCVNYYIHQYDDLTGVHYFGVAYQQQDGCSRFDQEFSLWITEDLKYYYSYIDSCEGFLLWKGNSQLAENFRAENQYQSIKSNDTHNRR